MGTNHPSVSDHKSELLVSHSEVRDTPRMCCAYVTVGNGAERLMSRFLKG